MSEELEIWVKISQQIGELNSSIKGVLQQVQNHEKRLREIEIGNVSGAGDFRSEIIRLLVKCLIISISVIASLVGAGSLVKGILGL